VEAILQFPLSVFSSRSSVMAVDSSLLYSCLLSKDGGGDEDEVLKCRVSEIQGLQFAVILDRERQSSIEQLRQQL
jgi:hypothetical protein